MTVCHEDLLFPAKSLSFGIDINSAFTLDDFGQDSSFDLRFVSLEDTLQLLNEFRFTNMNRRFGSSKWKPKCDSLFSLASFIATLFEHAVTYEVASFLRDLSNCALTAG